MASVNKAIILGNVGKDPEIRYDAAGSPIANFGVATSERYKDRDGVQQEKTEWHRVVMFGKQAGVVEQYVKKGQPVYVEGRIQTRTWTSKEGNEVTTTEIVGDRIQLLGGKRDGEPRPAQEAAKANGFQPSGFEDMEDDIPF